MSFAKADEVDVLGEAEVPGVYDGVVKEVGMSPRDSDEDRLELGQRS